MKRLSKKMLSITLITAIPLAILAYSYSRAYNLLFGPQIELSAPEGATVSSELLLVEGTAKNAAHLYLNDHPIFTDEEGHFREELLLSYGYTILELTAIDRFGQKEEKVIPLIYQ